MKSFYTMGLAALYLDSSTKRRVFVADAPAKINLVLDVVDRRADGFHEIRSVAIGVGLSDRITCTWPHPRGLALRCSDPTLQTPDNLALRAALALAQRKGTGPQIEIHLDKRIPVGAGLGGGSSDAAATLRLCNRIWETGLSDGELIALGAELGSDVPLFFHLPAVEMSGRGERVAPFSLRWRGHVLLVFPGVSVSTAEVYKAWRSDDGSSEPIDLRELQSVQSASELHTQLRNQLEPAVYRVCPRIREAQEALATLGLKHVCVTGSGSALFRLFDDPDEAGNAARLIQRRIPSMRTDVVQGPVDTFSVLEN